MKNSELADLAVRLVARADRIDEQIIYREVADIAAADAAERSSLELRSAARAIREYIQFRQAVAWHREGFWQGEIDRIATEDDEALWNMLERLGK